MPPSKAIAQKANMLSEVQNKQVADTVEELKEQVNDMQLEIDILKETINVLKKGQGVDMTELSSREKLQLVDALRAAYPLQKLLVILHFARSSYYYQMSAQAIPYKYSALQKSIVAVFAENHSCYGCRRIHAVLKTQGIIVSEAVDDAKRNRFRGDLSFFVGPKSGKNQECFASTKRVLNEHLLFWQRFGRQVSALIHHRKTPSWSIDRDGVFLYLRCC